MRCPPACPRQHSKELSPATNTAHGAPILPVFLGGKHCAIDFAKLHFPASPGHRASPEQRQEPASRVGAVGAFCHRHCGRPLLYIA